MKADRLRAAQSILDSLGADWWAWWRGALIGSLLLLSASMPLALVTQPAAGNAWTDVVLFLGALLVGTCVTWTAWLGAQRSARWRAAQHARRLPSAVSAQGWAGVELLVLGTFAAGSLGLAALAASLGSSQAAWQEATPWMVAMALAMAGGAALAQPERPVWLGVLIAAYLLMPPTGRLLPWLAEAQWQTSAQWAVLAAAAAVVVWGCNAPAGQPRPSKVFDLMSATDGGAWRLWRDRLAARMGALAPVLCIVVSSWSTKGSAFVPALLPNTASVMVLLNAATFLLFTVLYWQSDLLEARAQLTPTFARTRGQLGLRLWWEQVLRWVPAWLLVHIALGLLAFNWPRGMGQAAKGWALLASVPGVLVYVLLLQALATTWLGLRRQRHWPDFLLIALGAAGWVWFWLAAGPRNRLQGDSDFFASDTGRLTMVVALLALLPLMNWAWSRGRVGPMALHSRPWWVRFRAASAGRQQVG